MNYHTFGALPASMWVRSRLCGGEVLVVAGICDTYRKWGDAHGLFHSAQAALALVRLTCGPIELHPPHERAPG